MTTETILTMEDKRHIMDNNMIPWHPQVVAVINDAEQAVLQSSEIQALRKDADMLDWLISQEAQMQSMTRPNGGNAMYRVGWPDDGEYTVDWYSCPRAAIDAAMERQA